VERAGSPGSRGRAARPARARGCNEIRPTCDCADSWMTILPLHAPSRTACPSLAPTDAGGGPWRHARCGVRSAIPPRVTTRQRTSPRRGGSICPPDLYATVCSPRPRSVGPDCRSPGSVHLGTIPCPPHAEVTVEEPTLGYMRTRVSPTTIRLRSTSPNPCAGGRLGGCRRVIEPGAYIGAPACLVPKSVCGSASGPFVGHGSVVLV